MSILSRANVAQMVAKVVARRKTGQDEVSQLVESVHLALAGLGRTTEPEPFGKPSLPVPALRTRRQRSARIVADVPAIDDGMSVPAPAPRLVRRAEIVPAPTGNGDGGLLQVAPGGVLRGIVKWFDQRARRGALRLPGHSGDVPVEPALLDAMGISRLYKGQEVDATLSDDAAPRVAQLSLPSGGWNVNRNPGVVHNRHAKPVVVELKREALRRVAARVEAELLLGPNRAR